MAPTAPEQRFRMSHRAKALARIADPTLPRKIHRDNNAVTDAFLHSKRDKQMIRKSSFRARVAESAAAVSGRSETKQKALRRRRPSKKLVATLQSLADALPELEAADEAGNDTSKRSNWPDARRRSTSLRSRPGALKRKEKVVKAEMIRFGVNLAQLTATREERKEVMGAVATDSPESAAAESAVSTASAPAPISTANRWALLRNFISSTMEQSPAFSKS